MSYRLTYKDGGITRWITRSSYYQIICEKNKLFGKGFRNIKIEDLDKPKFTEDDFNPAIKKVQCVETGELFDTIKMASEIKNCCPNTLTRVLLKTPHYNTAGGYHWRYVYVN